MAQLWKACLVVFFALPAVGQDSNLRVTVPLIAFGPHHQPTSVSVQSLMITDQKVPVTGAGLLTGTDLPLELGVLIDTSNSRRSSNLGDTLKAINQLVSETIRGKDRVFLLTFDVTPHMTEWLNKDELQKTTVQVGAGGGTALYDSLAIACQQRLGPRDWTKPTRRALVLVSDGDDNQSRRTRGDAVSEALKSGAVIFTVDTSLTGVVSKGDKNMEYLAEQTGGESFDGVGRREIPKAFASIRELINGMYYLSYLPPSTPTNSLHDVEVKPAPKEKLKLAYARKYFWNP
jgi:Ca-activated chloride channel family protein